MSGAKRDLAAESWAFALQVYAEPGVGAACLRLQAEAGVDVMMLLVAAFAAARCGVVVSPLDVQQMDAVCRPWRERVVQPLRALRVALKSGPAPAPSPGAEKLRSQIKVSELAAERLENDLLADWLQCKAAVSSAVAIDDLHSVLRDVVRFAMERRDGQAIVEVGATIDEIAAVVRRISA
ncbi:TIGR02444 family protein [Tardiphaga sp.]|uniref:TIGR02444 family protein n=1 Tax=Tardiphaga sp. TaxID=1926292 RepID=UPI002605A9BD|nr:TIGR02444 family protein [Tardiphaga sp.]MDB5616775.1 hypothetical protein [Tardiphaga sp.]